MFQGPSFLKEVSSLPCVVCFRLLFLTTSRQHSVVQSGLLQEAETREKQASFHILDCQDRMTGSRLYFTAHLLVNTCTLLEKELVI